MKQTITQYAQAITPFYSPPFKCLTPRGVYAIALCVCAVATSVVSCFVIALKVGVLFRLFLHLKEKINCVTQEAKRNIYISYTRNGRRAIILNYMQ